jgi:hypothetical protein
MYVRTVAWKQGVKSGFSVSQVRLGSHSTLLLKWGSQREITLLKKQCCGLGFYGDHVFFSGFYRFPCLRIWIHMWSVHWDTNSIELRSSGSEFYCVSVSALEPLNQFEFFEKTEVSSVLALICLWDVNI